MTLRTYRGADLHCYYQREISWSTVDQSDLKFFIVQISRGDAPLSRVVDGKRYVPDSQIAGVRQIDRMLGGYHFCVKDLGSPEQQAAVFAGELRRWCALDVPPMFDVEGPGGFAPEEIDTAQFIFRFYRAMVQLGFPTVGLYSNAYFLSRIGLDLRKMRGLLVWGADYQVDAQGDPLPIRYYDGPVDVRQYSSKGQIPGIGPEFVDLNRSDLGFLRFYGAA